MRTSSPCLIALSAAVLLGAACGGGGETGPRPGSAEWSWDAAAEEQAAGEYGKAVEFLDDVIESDSELKNRAILWRAILQDGLARGHQELAEGYRLAMVEDDELAAQYQNSIQQAYRDGRQYSIAFAESMGDLEKALASPSPVLDFPFPSGVAAKPAPLVALEKGEAVLDSLAATLPGLLATRGVILSASELAGKGDDADAAQAAFQAGPVKLDPDQARLRVAKILLDRSVLFDRMRLYQPDIKKILVDRAETWAKPYLESENEETKARAEKLMEEIEDERLELDGKRRKLEARG